MSAASANAEPEIKTSSEEELPVPYRKIDKLEAYKLRVHNKLTYEQIADHLGVTRQAVHQALARFSEIIGEPDDITAGEDIRMSLFQAGRQTLLRSLVDEKAILNAPLKDRAIAFEKLDRAVRLESGQATQNLGVLGKIVVEAASELYQPKGNSKKLVDNQVATKQHETRMDTSD